MNISQILKTSIKALQNASVENPAFDARLLLSEALDKDIGYIIGHSDENLTQNQIEKYNQMIEKRANREPVAHILGKKEFWKDEFFVSSDVLSPRPDSEAVIESALLLYPDKNTPLKILDFGVGSGCLLLSLMREFPNAKGTGVDISKKALAITKKNAISLEHKLELIQSSWGDNINDCFDLIVSNPPYIKESEIENLQPEITKYEPYLALSGGFDGLRPFLPLFESIDKLLKQNGYVIVEIGQGQENEVIDIANTCGFSCVKMVKDISQIIRVLIFNRG